MQQAQKHGWIKRLGWLVLIWAASITVLAVVSLVLKLLMKAAGFQA